MKNFLKILIGSLALFLGVVHLGFGQGASNPFELSPRLKKTSETVLPPINDEEAAEIIEEVPAATASSGNPFDIIAPRTAISPVKKTVPQVAPDERVQLMKKTGSSPKEGRFKLTLTFIILAVVTILVTLFRPYINRVYRAVFNENLLSQYFRERETGRYLPYNLLYLLFFINLGFFIYLILDYYQLSIQANPYYSFSIITITVAGLFVLKQLVLLVLGYVFPIAKEVDLYSFSITIFSIFLGLVLIPVNLLVAYAPDNLTFVMILLGLGIFVAVYFLRALRGLFIANKYTLHYFFHFLLYICTVEIAPVILMSKFINDMI